MGDDEKAQPATAQLVEHQIVKRCVFAHCQICFATMRAKPALCFNLCHRLFFFISTACRSFTHFCPSGLHGRHLTHTQSSHFLTMQFFGHSMLEALSVGYFIELSAAIWPFIHFPPTSQPFILHIDVFMGKSVSSCRVSDKQVGHWKSASAGNRTRVTSMATMYSTTRPLMLMSHLNVGWTSF